MNWMQRHTVRELTLQDKARYKDLLPEGVDGNLYIYHINKLIKDGYIKRSQGGYALTNKGKQLAGYINVDTGLVRPQPKLCLMLDIRNSKGENLLWRWKRQPYMDLVSFPYGKAEFGKTISENVKHELNTKCNVSEYTYKFSGCAQINVYVKDKIQHQMFLQVYRINETINNASSNVNSGDCFWGNISELSEDEIAPGFKEISDLLEHKNYFFEEIDTVSKSDAS